MIYLKKLLKKSLTEFFLFLNHLIILNKRDKKSGIRIKLIWYKYYQFIFNIIIINQDEIVIQVLNHYIHIPLKEN